MDELCAQQRLVKSPPELWAEVSDPEALRRHLDLFGAIRVTRLEPETTVAWEGDRVSGTVVLDAAGWGTKVTLTADMREPAAPEPVTASTAGGSAHPNAEPPAADPPPTADPPERLGFLARLFRRRPVTASPAPPPAPASQRQAEPEIGPAPAPADPGPDPQTALDALEGVLDTLGAAHHRPFSR